MAVMGTNDKYPVSPAPLKPMQLVLVEKDGRVLLELLAFLVPIDELALPEPLQRKVDRFVERALIEGR